MIEGGIVQTAPTAIESNWKTLYRIGAFAALLAVFVFRRNLGAELMAFNGFGILTVPSTMPVSAAEWFALLHANPFVGLALLEVFDLVEYALVGVMFIALAVALWRSNRTAVLLGTICELIGIAVYFASNQAFALLSLSERYYAASTDAQRSPFLAAGESLLAIQNPGALYQGTGIYASLFLVLVGGLIISVVMWQSNVFSKAAAATGIVANGFMLAYYVALVAAPALVVLPFVISAPFRVVWYFLTARTLWRTAASTL